MPPLTWGVDRLKVEEEDVVLEGCYLVAGRHGNVASVANVSTVQVQNVARLETPVMVIIIIIIGIFILYKNNKNWPWPYAEKNLKVFNNLYFSIHFQK